MQLSQAKFDDKIMIFEFCIQKGIFNFWGALFLGDTPPPNSNF